MPKYKTGTYEVSLNGKLLSKKMLIKADKVLNQLKKISDSCGYSIDVVVSVLAALYLSKIKEK